MIQPAIQLVKHPGRARIDQQRAGATDQVVVIEQPGRVLALRIAVGDRGCQRYQRVRHRRQTAALAWRPRRDDAGGLLVITGQQVGLAGDQRLADQHGVAARLPLAPQEEVAPIGPMVLAPILGPGSANRALPHAFRDCRRTWRRQDIGRHRAAPPSPRQLTAPAISTCSVDAVAPKARRCAASRSAPSCMAAFSRWRSICKVLTCAPK